MANKDSKDKAVEEIKEVKKSKKGKVIALSIVILIVLGGIGYGGYAYWQGTQYIITENAKITAQLRNIMPLSSGRVVKWNVSEGSSVQENEVVGRLSNGSYMRAPMDGEIVKSSIVLNQMVSPTIVAAIVADTGDIYIGANIEEVDITKIKIGQEVTLELDAYPDQTFMGQVRQVDQVTQSALSGNATSFSTSGTYTKVTQLIPIEISLNEPDVLKGLIGTNATVKIKVK